jgi:hypothetical protein
MNTQRTIATRYLGSTLRPLSQTCRAKVKSLYHGPNGLNDSARELLARAIFLVENDLEHRTPRNEQVQALRNVRNVLYDDLGWNEPLESMRWPRVDATERLIREKRRTGNPLAFAR